MQADRANRESLVGGMKFGVTGEAEGVKGPAE